ncbi:MAG: CBS domain-containing protein [Methylococcales bacterium]|nr:CBS domain-containing protein [Methylococcales bacterium]
MSSQPDPSISWVQRMSQMFFAEPKDKTELLGVLRNAQERSLLNSHALAMVEGVLQVSAMQVRDIMIPRSQMVMVTRDGPAESIFKDVIESTHSRFPVYIDDRAEVVGILIAKDLLGYCIDTEKESFKIRDVMRPAIFVPESKSLDALLKTFQSSHNHMAIVVDEYGAASGLVTIEDVLEQIVGEIEDEHDLEDDGYILDHGDNEYTIKSLTPIDEFNEYFKQAVDSKGFDTIGGVVMNEFGHVPERGEKIHIGHYQFEVLRADLRRTYLFKLFIIQE